MSGIVVSLGADAIPGAGGHVVRGRSDRCGAGLPGRWTDAPARRCSYGGAGDRCTRVDCCGAVCSGSVADRVDGQSMIAARVRGVGGCDDRRGCGERVGGTSQRGLGPADVGQGAVRGAAACRGLEFFSRIRVIGDPNRLMRPSGWGLSVTLPPEKRAMELHLDIDSYQEQKSANTSEWELEAAFSGGLSWAVRDVVTTEAPQRTNSNPVNRRFTADTSLMARVTRGC